jgi:hypothetical protein
MSRSANARSGRKCDLDKFKLLPDSPYAEVDLNRFSAKTVLTFKSYLHVPSYPSSFLSSRFDGQLPIRRSLSNVSVVYSSPTPSQHSVRLAV